MTLVAVHSAIGCARMFVSHTLRRWNASCVEDDALLVVTELVTDAVTATGVIDEHPRWTELDHVNLIRVRLLGMDAGIAIEVWDSDPEPPESVRRKGNCLRPRSGGKVVWCQLAFPRYEEALDRSQPLPSSLPRRQRRPSARPTPRVTTEADPEPLKRVAGSHRHPDADDSGGGGDMGR